jgi:hypothetical protein
MAIVVTTDKEEPRMTKHNTTKDLATVIGRTGLMQSDKMQFEVTIHNVKQAFGRVDYLVRPVAGKDEAWVSSERVTVN